MAKLHDLRRERAALAIKTPELRLALREAKAAWRQKLEDMPVGEPVPDEAKPIEQRVNECEDAITEHTKQLDDHDSRIAEMERAQDDDGAEARELAELQRRGMGGNGGPRMTSWTGDGARVVAREGKGFKAARYAIGVLCAKSGNGLEWACNFVENQLGDKEVAKALNTTGVATGGALIPQYFSNEIIELLRAETVVRRCEPFIIDMPGGNMTIPRLAGGAVAGYQGELDDMSASQESFDDLQLNAKKLTALVPVSNDLIRRAPANIEQIVRDDMVQTLARREDLAFMLGDGTGTSPIGLLNQCNANQKLVVLPFTATDNLTILTAVVGVLKSMKLMLVMNMSRMIRPRWIMSPVVEAFFSGLRDGVGNFVYRDEMVTKGSIEGIKIFTTQQLPTNLTAAVFGGGTANDGSYLILADFADVILAETYRMMVDASDVASYKDSGGNIVSTFTRDQTAFRIIEEHDLAIRHQASLAVALLPGWAPPGYASFGPGAAYYVQAPSGDGSAAPSVWGIPPTGSSNPGNASAVAPGGTLPGRA